MKGGSKEPTFTTEADLCRAFIAAIPKEWTVYPETGGFDILIVRKIDGFQIGIEAKLKLNAKVITQSAEKQENWWVTSFGPDCRAVLIPSSASRDLEPICKLLGITVVSMKYEKANWERSHFRPELPENESPYADSDWHECYPQKRLELPNWIPDVEAGHSSPVALTFWKIGAIKLAIVMERKGFLTRKDFKDFKISMSRWTQGKWIVPNGSGGWVRGDYFPDFRKQHPVNYVQIEADYEKWIPQQDLAA